MIAIFRIICMKFIFQKRKTGRRCLRKAIPVDTPRSRLATVLGLPGAKKNWQSYNKLGGSATAERLAVAPLTLTGSADYLEYSQ